MQKTLQKPRVVILGAGFGGLTAARKMADFADVTVVDRHNFQTFLPLLYQVSTAGLAADHVAHPIRGALRKTGIQFRMGTPISVDHKNKNVKLDSSEVLDFDYLVVALGSATADFGIPGVTEHALGMKSVHEALAIRAEVLRRFEDLCRFEDETLFSISVVGGGPTGVEMAGAFAELVRGPLKHDQAHAAAHIKINLIEAGPRILPMFSEKLSARGKKDLEKLGVTVHLNTAVKEIKPRMIEVSDGSKIPSEVTIWAAGVKGVLIDGIPTEAVNPRSRVLVDDYCKVKGLEDVYAIGDVAAMYVTEYPQGHPQVAPVAVQMGDLVAENYKRAKQGKELKKFEYFDKGSMATVGRNRAVVEVGKLRFGGLLGWLAWMFLHLMLLVGFRNRVVVFINWLWNYVSYNRNIRLIIRPYYKPTAS